MHDTKELRQYINGLDTFTILKRIYSDNGHRDAYITEFHDRGGNIESLEISVNNVLQRVAHETDNK